MVKTPYKSKSYESKDWQDFERLVALVEKRLAPAGAVVTYNDRIPPLVPSTRRPIQVDASIRMDVGSTTILVTIEARFKSRRQGTAWIEQLATRREEIGASKTIAVTNKGFDASVHELAARKGIELRVLNQITEDDIDGWAQIPSMIHAHRYVKSIESFVELMDGELVEIDAMEACFRHPEVHSPFPAVAFVAFADIRAPGTVWNTPVDGSAATAELVFDGQNPELMPVPLGHKRRAGALEFCYNDDYRPVKSLRLKLDARLVFDALTAKDGRHFDYSTPDKHIAMLSQYTGKIGDHEVGIETLRHPDGRVSSETRLSPDLVLPGELISPVLTNMSTVDTNSMQGKPIRIVLNDGDSFLCVLMAPQHKWFKKHVDVKKFDKEYFICGERSGWKSLSDALHNTGGYISFDDVRTILRNDVKSIDLTPSIDAIIGMSNK